MIYINRIILFLFFRALAGHMFDWNECSRSVQCLLLIHLILDLQDHPSYKKSCSTVLHIYWTWISFHTLSLSLSTWVKKVQALMLDPPLFWWQTVVTGQDLELEMLQPLLQWRLQACEDDDAAFQEEATKAGKMSDFHRLSWSFITSRLDAITPRKVTWNPKMTRLKREIIFQISILRFHFFLWGVYVCIFVMCVHIHPDYAVGYRLAFPAFLLLV